jgi:hypothetical protein
VLLLLLLLLLSCFKDQVGTWQDFLILRRKLYHLFWITNLLYLFLQDQRLRHDASDENQLVPELLKHVVFPTIGFLVLSSIDLLRPFPVCAYVCVFNNNDNCNQSIDEAPSEHKKLTLCREMTT